ncbi:hypothetical protein [Trueperella bialowiezensis]|uniref:Uncharacterized protein n=1 Tax=Trueperella bialowiezensis TaxID=312285 RepID=A0A3S4WFQ8_9ACTO|nr:hypothetical protein [Trueperella bialowiezensis]VEI12869.1 Uncharacterised protein [Trueperella bialowiezensis]
MKTITALICATTLSLAYLTSDPHTDSTGDSPTLDALEQEVTLHTQDTLSLSNPSELAVGPPNLFELISEDGDLKQFYVYDDDRGQALLTIPVDRAVLTHQFGNNHPEIAGIPFSAQTDSDPDQTVLRVSQFTGEEIEASLDAIQDYLEAEGISGALEYDGWTDTIVLLGDPQDIDVSALPPTSLPIVFEGAVVSSATSGSE